MSYTNVGKSKSRSKLWNRVGGANLLVGAAGVGANWTISFPNLAAANDTITIGPYVFKYVADGEEDTVGESAGTAADPHLISIGGTPTATTAAANLKTAMLAETATTGKWGFLNPVNTVGASNSSGVLTINFFPGTFANASTYITQTSTGTDPTITNVSDGTAPKFLNTNYKWNVIDTTGSGTNKEYYYLPDGKVIGEECNVIIKTLAASDTPTIIGHLSDAGVAQVEALAATAGMSASFVWTGSVWELANEGNGTALVFDAAT